MTVPVNPIQRRGSGLNDLATLTSIASNVRSFGSSGGSAGDAGGPTPKGSLGESVPNGSNPPVSPSQPKIITSPHSAKNPQFQDAMMRRRDASNNAQSQLLSGYEALSQVDPMTRARLAPVLEQAIRKSGGIA